MNILLRFFRWLGVVEDEPTEKAPLAPTGTDGAYAAIPAPRTARFVPEDNPGLRVIPQATGETIGGEWWVPRGVPVLTAQSEDADEAIDEALHAHLTQILNSPEVELPRLPRVAQKALSMLGGDNTNFKALGDLIGQDPALSADVLRIANSAAFRGIREIANLEHAFSRLGTRELRSMILSKHTKGLMIRTGGAEKTLGEELWQRAVASAEFMTQMAPRYRLPQDEAFLAGLLHDIGSLALLRIMHDHHKAHGRRVQRPLFSRLNTEWHEHLGLRLADDWNLPEPLPFLIGQHHQVEAADGTHGRYLLLIQLSDVVCSMMGYGPYVPYDFFHLPCVRALELHDNPPTRELLALLPEKIALRLEQT